MEDAPSRRRQRAVTKLLPGRPAAAAAVARAPMEGTPHEGGFFTPPAPPTPPRRGPAGHFCTPLARQGEARLR